MRLDSFALRSRCALNLKGRSEVKRTYGYGIVNCRGETYWDESCVCEDRGPLQELAATMNAHRCYGGEPFRVVRLFWMSSTKRRRTPPQKDEE